MRTPNDLLANIRRVFTPDVRQVASADQINVRGEFRLIKAFADGRTEVVVNDPNLVVTLGRRVMSRAIAGAATFPSILQTVLPAIRIIRTTAGSATAATAQFSLPSAGNCRLVLSKTIASVTTVDSAINFVAGTTTLTQLITQINAVGQGQWRAAVVGAVGANDASSLISVNSATCLGDAGPYNAGNFDAPDSANKARTLYAIATLTRPVTAPDLAVTGMRFGTEGATIADAAVAKGVLASDEQMVCKVRASEYGNAAEADDLLTSVVSYTNSAQVMFKSSLAVSQGNGLSVSEAGLFTPTFLVAKKNFGAVVKSGAFSLEVEWTLIF